MATAKDIVVKVIPSKIANEFTKKHHYSGKVVNNSQLHFGCFLDGKLHGVMQFGCPLDKRKVMGLVVDKDGNETSFAISSDKKTVGDALLAEGLIEGENGAYGLYVKKVNGITADYDTDKTYWAIYEGEAYASTGIDGITIVNNATYKLVASK